MTGHGLSRRQVLAVAGSASVLAACGGPAPSEPLSRSAWVWKLTAGLLDDAESAGVDRLLVWFGTDLIDDRSSLLARERLVSAATDRGITVDALGGDASWAEEPRRCRDWARQVAALSLVQTLHLDVEPHGADDWESRRGALAAGLVDAVAAAAESGLRVDVDVALQYADVAGPGGGLLPSLFEVADELTLMAYRDRARSVVAAAEPTLAVARRAGRSVRIGVNVSEVDGDAPHTVLDHDGGDPAHELAELDRLLRDRSEVAGLAIHHAAQLDRVSS